MWISVLLIIFLLLSVTLMGTYFVSYEADDFSLEQDSEPVQKTPLSTNPLVAEELSVSDRESPSPSFESQGPLV
jgi:hypothetical protein